MSRDDESYDPRVHRDPVLVRASGLPQPDPGRRGVTVFCDETGTHDCEFFGWGSIWCPTDQVGEFEAIVDRICDDHRARTELGWKYADRYVLCMEDVIEAFFRVPWICFQSLFVRKEDMQIFDEDRAVAFRKVLCTLIATQVRRFHNLPGGPRSFEVRVDEYGRTSRDLTRQELRIMSATTRKWSNGAEPLVTSLGRLDSRTSRGIQLADILVGALRSSWEHNPRYAKGRICDTVAHHLGWESLRAVTHPNLKFNVWLHHSATDHDLHPRPLDLLVPEGDPQHIFDALPTPP